VILGRAPSFGTPTQSVGKASAAVSGRSREQRLRAMQQANRMRLARAKLKKELASDTLELAQILAERPSASGGQGCANCC
jgi:hypothetical protein